MEDYRYRLIEIEEDFVDDDEEEEEEDYERDQHLIPEGIMSPVHLGIFTTGEYEDGDEFDDDDDDDDDEEEDEEEYEEEEELRMLPRDLDNSIEDDYYEDGDDDDVDDDDDDDEDYGEEGEEEDYEEEGELEELFPVVMTSPRVSNSVVQGGSLQGVMVINNGGLEDSNGGSETCEGKPGCQENCGGEFLGSFCPICFDAWSSGGEHQICCLPCGHIYGLSCIKKWLQESRSSGKCPQCNNICTLKDVRVLYASRLCVADEELQKRVRSLEAKCAYLEQKAGQLTPDELIDQICSNPAAVQRLAAVLAGLTQQPVSP